MALDPTSNYEDLYLSGIRNSDYNVMLRDHSFFQFTLNADGCRLAFYPNPFFGADREKVAETAQLREFVDEGIMGMEDYLHTISELRSTVQAPLIRYEYSTEGYKSLHRPCGHFHIGSHSENRWAVERHLSPLVFGMMILRLYYSDTWQKAPALIRGREEVSLDEYFMRSKVEREVTPLDYLNANDRKLFYSLNVTCEFVNAG